MEEWRIWNIIDTRQAEATQSDLVLVSGEPGNNPPYPPMLHLFNHHGKKIEYNNSNNYNQPYR
jgi:hypothetical protein